MGTSVRCIPKNHWWNARPPSTTHMPHNWMRAKSASFRAITGSMSWTPKSPRTAAMMSGT